METSCVDRRRSPARHKIGRAAIWFLVALTVAPGRTSAAQIPEACEAFRNEITAAELVRGTTAITFPKMIDSLHQRFGKFSRIGPSDEQRSVSEVLTAEKLEDSDFRFHESISHSMNGYEFYWIDLNGDGTRDLVIEGIGGTLGCHNYDVFVRGSDGKLVAVRGPDFRAFEDEAHVCIGSGVKVELARYEDGPVFFLLLSETDRDRSVYFYSVDRAGTSKFECHIKFDRRGGVVVDKKAPEMPEPMRNMP